MAESRTGPDDTRKPFEEQYFDCAANGKLDEVKYLLKATVHVDLRNEKGWTALMFAARNGHVDIVNTLLEQGLFAIMAESRTGPDDTRKPFEEQYFDCAANGKLDEVKYLLKATVHVDLRNEKGWTALMFAARNGHVDIVNTLLEQGLFAIMAESRTGPDDTRKPFEEQYFDCAANGKLDEVKYLLKATVHVDLRNEKGWTALMFAARNGHVDIVNTLLEQGLFAIMAESRTGPDDTRKPFEEQYFDCAANGKLDEVKYLLKATVHVDLRNEKGWTALMFAARNGHVDIVNTLLEQGCDVNLVNKTGQTAQDIALFWDQAQIANLLMEYVKTTNPDKQLRNFFSLNLLNRYAEKRKDKEWLNSAMRNPDTKYILFSDLKPLVVPIPIKNSRWKFSLARVDSNDLQSHLKTNPLVVFLGLESVPGESKMQTADSKDRKALFAIDVSSVEESVYTNLVPKSEFAAGFPLALQLEPSDAGILAEARIVLDWLDRYKFCATCGSSTTVLEGGYKRTCENKECKSNKGVHNTCYPRTDPSVIMLVISQDGKRCLLGRQKRFPAKMWSCLAGFIEPGESIEDACRREVEEESGIKVGHVDYHSSQPWPFPASLMLGCTAYAITDNIQVDEDEMEDARWFRRPEVVQMLTHQHPQGLYVPPDQAIAHQIIKSWVRMTANL